MSLTGPISRAGSVLVYYDVTLTLKAVVTSIDSIMDFLANSALLNLMNATIANRVVDPNYLQAVFEGQLESASKYSPVIRVRSSQRSVYCSDFRRAAGGRGSDCVPVQCVSSLLQMHPWTSGRGHLPATL